MPDKQIEEEITFLTWDAPERIYTKRGKTYFRNLFTLLGMLAVVAIFFKEFLLAGVLAALGFLQWAMSSKPPRIARYSITTRGISAHGHTYEWEQLRDFWFAEHSGQVILHIDTKSLYPGRLYLPLGKVSKEEITRTLSDHIPHRQKAREDLVDKISVEISRRFPLE